MTRRAMVRCTWCGQMFRAGGSSVVLYCKRAHKTAAEKWRKECRAEAAAQCQWPEHPLAPNRGEALANRPKEHRVRPCHPCAGFHVVPNTQNSAVNASSGGRCSGPRRS